ncbi:MAG: hypothetical protein FWG81_10390 [Betaproteobacteria bacterium]|nr:hypothetical protein [Betaproteobacteria bacterium]
MEIPLSMKTELGEWNGGKGIDLESWVGCEGRFSLAVGYTTVFWPDLEEIEGYILRNGVSVDIIRGFESQEGSSRRSVEATLNHIHLVDIHYHGCPDASPDKLLALGQVLKEIYEAKLKWQFPLRPCNVRLYVPEDPNALNDYELSFWQTAHEVADA